MPPALALLTAGDEAVRAIRTKVLARNQEKEVGCIHDNTLLDAESTPSGPDHRHERNDAENSSH